MKKTTRYIIVCVCLLLGIVSLYIWNHSYQSKQTSANYDDNPEQIDLDSIYLSDSDIQVDFSEVLLSKHEETRKLIVTTQEATVSTTLTDRLVKQLDFSFLKKSQDVSYTGTGYFVVDLDKLTKQDILENKKDKTITIQIKHAYLQAIEIDPEKVIIDEVKEGLLARGDIKLTVSDYNTIEVELKNRLYEAFDTAENGQKANKIAQKMVKEIYEPLVKAIKPSYEVIVEFK